MRFQLPILARIYIWIVSIVIGSVITLPVFAHTLDYRVVTTQITIDGADITFQTEYPLAVAVAPTAQDQLAMELYYQRRFIVFYQGQCNIQVDSLRMDDARGRSYIEGEIQCLQTPVSVDDLEVTSTLFANVFKHFDHTVIVMRDGVQRQIVFSVGGAALQTNQSQTEETTVGTVLATANTPLGSVFHRFVGLGMTHVWFGFDHLLFLFAAILILTSVRQILIVVTSFTVAHSLTLLASSVGILTVPEWFVTPVVAASILVMGVRNMTLVYQGQAVFLRERWIETAVFGLVHGLGFAQALAGVGVASTAFIPALFSFNLGIELGQLIVVLLLLPILLYTTTQTQRFRAGMLLGISGMISMIALMWLVQQFV